MIQVNCTGRVPCNRIYVNGNGRPILYESSSGALLADVGSKEFWCYTLRWFLKDGELYTTTANFPQPGVFPTPLRSEYRRGDQWKIFTQCTDYERLRKYLTRIGKNSMFDIVELDGAFDPCNVELPFKEFQRLQLSLLDRL